METARPLAEVDEVSARALLEAVSGAVVSRRLAEVEEMVLAEQWAILHGEPCDERDPMTHPGGDGTPEVRDYALPELAMARETHTATTRALVADTLDLVHRLPRIWDHVRAGACEPWVARRVAVMSRALLASQVGVVDRAVAAAICAHAPSTVFQIAEAKMIEADPETHAAERERARHERYVRLSKADEFGFRCVIAKVTAGDAAWIDAMVERVAEILALTHGHDHNHDELRSEAMGWLARPVDLLTLLMTHADPSGERPAWAPEHTAETVARLCALSDRKLASLRSRGSIFVHLTEEALRTKTGIARVEGLGPIPVANLRDVLGHCDVRVIPVRDLHERPRADAYEYPDRFKDQAWLHTGGDVFPFSPRTATRASVDFDHSVPFDPHGPPGQTGPHNCGPLRRRHHRWKTFGGYRCRPAGPGRHLWQTPNGLCFLVDQSGTRRLDGVEAEIMRDAPPGLDIYVTPFQLEWAGG